MSMEEIPDTITTSAVPFRPCLHLCQLLEAQGHDYLVTNNVLYCTDWRDGQSLCPLFALLPKSLLQEQGAKEQEQPQRCVG